MPEVLQDKLTAEVNHINDEMKRLREAQDKAQFSQQCQDRRQEKQKHFVDVQFN